MIGTSTENAHFSELLSNKVRYILTTHLLTRSLSITKYIFVLSSRRQAHKIKTRSIYYLTYDLFKYFQTLLNVICCYQLRIIVFGTVVQRSSLLEVFVELKLKFDFASSSILHMQCKGFTSRIQVLSPIPGELRVS